jgi:hypothetical protein
LTQVEQWIATELLPAQLCRCRDQVLSNDQPCISDTHIRLDEWFEGARNDLGWDPSKVAQGDTEVKVTRGGTKGIGSWAEPEAVMPFDLYKLHVWTALREFASPRDLEGKEGHH